VWEGALRLYPESQFLQRPKELMRQGR